MDTFELLTHTGMTKKEAAVYTTLLENGVQTITSISKATHINRPALYTLLPKMQRDGVISQVQKQKRIFYQAESPHKILVKYKDEQADVTKRLTDLAETFELHQTDRPTIKYFEGKKGVQFVFDDIAHSLPRGGEFYRYTSYTGDDRPYAHTYYAKVRDTKQLERLVITSEEKAALKSKKIDRAVKAIPKEFDLFVDNISLVIYGDKTAYVDYTSQAAFIVESAKIARFQEKLFKLLWKKL